MLLHIILSLLSTFPFTTALGTNLTSKAIYDIAKPNCSTHCGDIAVPYPFGIGNDTGCAFDNSFYVTYNKSYDTPKLFLRSGNLEIYNISDSELRVATGAAYMCYNQNGTLDDHNVDWWTRLGAFTFSEKNTLTVLGCDDYAVIKGTNGAQSSSGCLGLCSKAQDVPNNGLCSGMGCCQTSIPKGLSNYNVTLYTFQNHTDVWSFNNCGYAFLGDRGTFEFHGVSDLYPDSGVADRIKTSVQVVVDWVIAPDTRGCSDQSVECKENSSCYDVDSGGYRCRCNNGYQGNPYLDPGCQDGEIHGMI